MIVPTFYSKIVYSYILEKDDFSRLSNMVSIVQTCEYNYADYVDCALLNVDPHFPTMQNVVWVLGSLFFIGKPKVKPLRFHLLCIW